MGLARLRCVLATLCWLRDRGVCTKRLSSTWTTRLSRRPGRRLHGKGSAVLGHWAAAPMKERISSFREPPGRPRSWQAGHYHTLRAGWHPGRQNTELGDRSTSLKAPVQVQDALGAVRGQVGGNTLHIQASKGPSLGNAAILISSPLFPMRTHVHSLCLRRFYVVALFLCRKRYDTCTQCLHLVFKIPGLV